jgi:hypothetical protein
MHKKVAGILCVALLYAGAALGASGQDDGKKKLKELNVDFSPGWGGCYRPMEWTPVLIGVTTPFDKPLDCIVEMSAPQDELNNLVISRREVFMPGRPKQVPLATKFRYWADNCTVTIYSPQTGFHWRQTYDLMNRSSGVRNLTPVEQWDVLIGVSGKQGFGIMELPQAAASDHSGQRGKVYTQFMFQRLLPADWTGYAALDMLLLYDAEWTQLTRHQAQAIVQWVSNGGRLMVVLGSNVLPADHPLAKLLPFAVGQPSQARLSRRELSDWGCRGWKKDTVTCWSLEAAKGARMWETQALDAKSIYLASGPAGFGKVAVCGIDPTVLECLQDRNLANFWVPRIRPMLDPRSITLSNGPEDRSESHEYQLGPAGQATNAVMEHLYALEELRPIHIGWIVLVLVSLALLIGPVDYLVLRKLGHLPLTWITSSVYIAVFSVGAYYGVEYLRGGVLQARVVSVVDGVDGTATAWATRYMGIFAPHSDEYKLDGLDRGQWWSGMAPTDRNELSRYGDRLGSRNIYCVQHEDGGNLPTSVPINIWAMQCLQSESPQAKMPLAASVRRGEGREWIVEVRNTSTVPISGGYAVVSRNQSVPFGRVGPGQTQEFRAPAEAWRNWEDAVNFEGHPHQVPANATRVILSTVTGAQGACQRTAGILAYLSAGAAVVCAEFEAPPVPMSIAGRQCRFLHRELARLVVLPDGRK